MWDSALHLANSLEHLKYLASGEFNAGQFLSLSPYYPPMFYFLLIPVLWIHNTFEAALLIHLPFLLILTGSVYYLGLRWSGSRRLASIAAFLTAAMPRVQWLCHDLLQDLEVLSLTALLLALATASLHFSKRTLVVLLGACAGFAVLLKWTIIFYCGPPLLVMAVLALRHTPAGSGRRRCLVSLLLAVATAAVIAAPWYLQNINYLLGHFSAYTQDLGALEGDPGRWTLDGWTYYLRALLGWTLFLPFFLLAAIGTGLAFRRWREARLVLAVWIIAPYLIFSMFSNKDFRHITPVIPALALTSAWFVHQLKIRWLQRTLLAGIFTAGAAQAWMVSFGVPSLPRALSFYTLDRPAFQERTLQRAGPSGFSEQIVSWPDGWFLYQQDAFGIWGPPRREQWPLREILHAAVQGKPSGSMVSLGVIPDDTRFNVWAFRYTALQEKLPVVVWRTGELDADAQCFAPYQFVLFKEGKQGPVWTTTGCSTLMEFVLSQPGQFSPCGSWLLPDGSTARLFENRRADPARFPPTNPWPIE